MQKKLKAVYNLNKILYFSLHFIAEVASDQCFFFEVWLEEPLSNFERPLIFCPIVSEHT